MHINVDSKPVASNACDSKKHARVETIDRLYQRCARGPQQKILSWPSSVLHNIMNRRVTSVTTDADQTTVNEATGAIDIRDTVPLVLKELHCRFDTLKDSAVILLVAGRLICRPEFFKFRRLWLFTELIQPSCRGRTETVLDGIGRLS